MGRDSGFLANSRPREGSPGVEGVCEKSDGLMEGVGVGVLFIFPTWLNFNEIHDVTHHKFGIIYFFRVPKTWAFGNLLWCYSIITPPFGTISTIGKSSGKRRRRPTTSKFNCFAPP